MKNEASRRVDGDATELRAAAEGEQAQSDQGSAELSERARANMRSGSGHLREELNVQNQQ